ncbi:BspA family leucine-rich repeat surface protein, partial [Bathymodiolus thermophilus thioautotrophic gill symbiont]
MFYEATAFNQNLGSWDISSLTDAEGMFVTTSMTTANMDNTLRGWAKLDIVAGEAAIQRDVAWDIANYTDATAKQYLIDTYNWTIEAITYDGINRIKVDFDGFDGSKTIQGSNTQSDTLFTTSAKTTIHGLGGNDNLNGGTTDDILIGGAGNDILTGGGGSDTFDYGFTNAGNDWIKDFVVGDKYDLDVIDLSDLLIGYGSASYLSDFVTASAADSTADNIFTRLTIDH